MEHHPHRILFLEVLLVLLLPALPHVRHRITRSRVTSAGFIAFGPCETLIKEFRVVRRLVARLLEAIMVGIMEDITRHSQVAATGVLNTDNPPPFPRQVKFLSIPCI